MVLIFPKTDNVDILLKDIAFVTYLLPVHQRAYLGAKIFEGYARSGSRI
jgi:hypothetical protein